MWKSKNNFQESALSSSIVIPELRLRSAGLGDKHLYQLSHHDNYLVLETGSLTGLDGKPQGLSLPPSRALVSSATSHLDSRGHTQAPTLPQ